VNGRGTSIAPSAPLVTGVRAAGVPTPGNNMPSNSISRCDSANVVKTEVAIAAALQPMSSALAQAL
jgi:hypothetical protein